MTAKISKIHEMENNKIHPVRQFWVYIVHIEKFLVYGTPVHFFI